MTINFKCKQSEFQQIDWFFNSQQYDSKPMFDEIVLDVEGKTYKYGIEQQFNHWYIITI